jgi:hypothetical protein
MSCASGLSRTRNSRGELSDRWRCGSRKHKHNNRTSWFGQVDSREPLTHGASHPPSFVGSTFEFDTRAPGTPSSSQLTPNLASDLASLLYPAALSEAGIIKQLAIESFQGGWWSPRSMNTSIYAGQCTPPRSSGNAVRRVSESRTSSTSSPSASKNKHDPLNASRSADMIVRCGVVAWSNEGRQWRLIEWSGSLCRAAGARLVRTRPALR